MKRNNMESKQKISNLEKSCHWLRHKLEWFGQHMVLTAIVSSIVFALVVHILFKTPAINEWFIPKWGAGDVLTYSSTVALGLLAVWQNQKFKEANDKAQKEMEIQNANAQDRLERINREANEISYIGKIIDFEKQYLETVEASLNDFIRVAGFASMMDTAFSDELTNDDLYNLKHQIMRKYEVVIHFTKAAYIVQNDKSAELNSLYSAMQKLACELIDLKLNTKEISEESLNRMGEIDIDLSYTKLIYISIRQALLNRIMFEKWSLEMVRSCYLAPGEKSDKGSQSGAVELVEQN